MPTDNNWIVDIWNWAKRNDLPNWAVAALTVLWSLVMVIWSHRKVNRIPHLEVNFQPGNIEIGENPHIAIAIDFINHTGSSVYLAGAMIKRCSDLFCVPIDASRDIADSSYHLKFLDQSGHFVLREHTLQTNESVRSSMATTSELPPSFFSYTPPMYCRLLRIRKYFVLEYTVTVGMKKRTVSTLY